MGLTNMKAGDGGGNYDKPTPGNVSAVCIRMIDIGTHPGSQQFPKEKRKVRVYWEIDEKSEEGEYAGKRYVQMAQYTLSAHENATFRHILESWRGRKYGPAEAMNPKGCLGQPCLLNLVESEDGNYVNVQSVSPLPRGMERLTPENDLLFLDLDEFDQDVYDKLPPRTQEKIRESPEGRKLFWGDGEQPTQEQRLGQAARQMDQRQQAAPQEPPAGQFDEDDIPF